METSCVDVNTVISDLNSAIDTAADLVFQTNMAFLVIGLMIGFVLPYLVHGFIVAPLLERLRNLDKKEDDLRI